MASALDGSLTTLMWLQELGQANCVLVKDRIRKEKARRGNNDERDQQENNTFGRGQDSSCGSSSARPEDKPSFTYATLITLAIQSSAEQRMTLSGIYQWITDHFPFFRNTELNWKNSIRHNLSINPLFVKVPRSTNDPGKGGYWSIDPAVLEEYLPMHDTAEPAATPASQAKDLQPNCVKPTIGPIQPELHKDCCVTTSACLPPRDPNWDGFSRLSQSFRNLYRSIFEDLPNNATQSEDLLFHDWPQREKDNLRESFRLVSSYDWDEFDLEEIPGLLESMRRTGDWPLNYQQFLDLAASLRFKTADGDPALNMNSPDAWSSLGRPSCQQSFNPDPFVDESMEEEESIWDKIAESMS